MSFNLSLHHYTDYPNVERSSDIVQPGTVILTCTPFVYSLSPKFADIRCDTCFFSVEETSAVDDGHPRQLSRCSGCQQVRYCNRDCQRKGWSDGHKYECKGFKAHNRSTGTFTRMLLRIIVKQSSGNDYFDEITHRRIRRRFKDLVSHYSDVKSDSIRMERIETLFAVVQSILVFHPEIKLPNESELIGICGRIFVNTFSITDYENHTLGSGLYLGASIFDHSCEPLAVPTFESTTLFIRNIREFPKLFPILKVTICYRDTLRPTPVRQTDLLKQYYFECQCEWCSNKSYDYAMKCMTCSNEKIDCQEQVNLEINKNKCPKCSYVFEESKVNKILEMEEMVKGKIEEMSENGYLDVAEASLRILNGLKFSEKHWLVLEMNQVGFDCCIEMKQWERAYQFGEKVLQGNRLYLYKFHPSLGLLLLKLGKLAWFLEKEAEAKSYLVQAKRILDITHGSDSPFLYKNLYPLLQEISLCSSFKNGM